jgi:hypothetical protein
MQKYSREFIEYVNNLSIWEEYRNTFGHPLPAGKFFCPFHTNVNTPAAKVYGNHIKCFSCNRNYTVFDLLRAFNPSRLDSLSKSVVAGPDKSQFRPPRVIKVPPLSELDLSKGVTVELLNKIIEYGTEKNS